MSLYRCVFFCGLTASFFLSCKHQPENRVAPAVSDNYPAPIGRIITTKCATAGCHNAASYQTSGGGLRLDTWEHLFDGGNTGAAIIPYSPENSPLLYFTNAYEDLGDIPPDDMKMPLNNPSLTREEYLVLRNWVAEGAPDKNGNIPFASNSDTRQKIYVAHRGCDFVYVIDAEKNVAMRCISVGTQPTIEVGYSLKIAPDDNAYLNLWGNEIIQKINTQTDQWVENISTGYPNSSVLHAPANGEDILLSNFFLGSLMRINTQTKQVVTTYGNGNIPAPHGIAANKTRDTFFVTGLNGNVVYKLADGYLEKISIDGKPYSGTGPDPYSIIMSPDHSQYFIACSATNEVRVMDAYADTLRAVIDVGVYPTEMAISKSKPYLFVSCMDDPANIPLFKGSVYVINYFTNQVVAKITDRYHMPHALAVDDRSGKLFVFSRNIDPDGPVPHHQSSLCEGRNGYYSVYDFHQLKPVNNKRYELTIDPFAADVRFK